MSLRDLMDSMGRLLLRVRGEGDKDRIPPLPRSIAVRIRAHVDEWPAVIDRAANPAYPPSRPRAGQPRNKNQIEYR